MSDHFHPEKFLAGGPAAKVYRGVEIATGRKVLFKSLLNESESPHALDREKLQLLAPTLMQVRHPQIAGLITLVPTEDEFALVYEFMPGMNVRTFAAQRQVAAADLRALAVQLMHALLVGEQHRLPHGDPKPSNLIIADHPSGGLFVQVQDWGLSTAHSTPPPETLWFRAPELHSGMLPTSQSDLFTIAASLFCLATNSAPAQGDDPGDLIRQWQAFDMGHALRQLRPDLDAPLIDWLVWLSRCDPRVRPHSVSQALDMLMPMMHTGFIPMPMQPPQMMPGFQTAPLTSPAAAHPNAPKAKPVTPKSPAAKPPSTKPASATSSPVSNGAPPPVKKGSRKRALIAVTLNLVALGMVGFFLWPFAYQSLAGWHLSTEHGNQASLSTSAAAPTPPSTPQAKTQPVKGRFIRIEQPGGAPLNLAEVQVFSGGKNVALQGNASQSSTAPNAQAKLAIDGRTNGDLAKGKSVMRTQTGKRDPWWQVDLKRELPLEKIVLWNRTDGKSADHAANLTVKVITARLQITWEKKNLPAPSPDLELKPGH